MILYTKSGSTTAIWLPPVVTDNNDIPRPANGSMAPGGQLAPGDHNVRYTAQDSAGNLEGCSFVISVKEEGLCIES